MYVAVSALQEGEGLPGHTHMAVTKAANIARLPSTPNRTPRSLSNSTTTVNSPFMKAGTAMSVALILLIRRLTGGGPAASEEAKATSESAARAC